MPVEIRAYCLNCGREMIVKTTLYEKTAYKSLVKTYRFGHKKYRFEVIYECRTCGHKTLLVHTAD